MLKVPQVASFKLTGKRIFRMAPLHHHFELKGWPEPRVIVRFWIITVILVLVVITSYSIHYTKLYESAAPWWRWAPTIRARSVI